MSTNSKNKKLFAKQQQLSDKLTKMLLSKDTSIKEINAILDKLEQK